MSDVAVLERLYRRVLGLVLRGRLTLIDDTKAAQLVQVKFKSDDIRDKLPRVQDFGVTSVPLPGADVIVVNLAGERSNGVVIAVNDQARRPTGLQAGDVCVYDGHGHTVRFTSAGIFVEGGSDTISVHTGGSVIVDAGGDIVTSGAGSTVVNTAAAFFNCPVTFTQLATFSGGIMAGSKDIGGSHEHSGGTISGHTGPPL